MSSIYNQFGQFSASKNSIRNPNAGFVLGNGTDAAGAREIGSIGNNFVGTVSTVTSPNAYRIAPGDRIPNNVQGEAIPNFTPRSLKTTTTFAPTGLVRLKTSEFPYFQPVPDLGKNPDALTLLSASTQFQADLQTVGPRALPGFPVIDLNHNADHTDTMGVTQAFMNSMVPFYPLADLSGAFLPGAEGGGYYYAPPNVHPNYEYGPFQATNYKQFTPVTLTPAPNNTASSTVSGTNVNVSVNPNRIAATGSPRISNVVSSFNGYPLSYSAYPGLAESFGGTYSNGIRTKTSKSQANSKNQQGKYNLGVKKSPFTKSFQNSASSFVFDASNTGVITVHPKGLIKGSTDANVIRTSPSQASVVDGNGGRDTIFTGANNDTVNARQGDKVFTSGGNDAIYYEFTLDSAPGNPQTAIDGGSGVDTLILVVPGNAKNISFNPKFTKQSDGSIKVEMRGQVAFIRNIESIIVTDPQGNVGMNYNVATGQSTTG